MPTTRPTKTPTAPSARGTADQDFLLALRRFSSASAMPWATAVRITRYSTATLSSESNTHPMPWSTA